MPFKEVKLFVDTFKFFFARTNLYQTLLSIDLGVFYQSFYQYFNNTDTAEEEDSCNRLAVFLFP